MAQYIDIENKQKRIRRPLYQRWCNIKSRCYNSSSAAYLRYGERGIKMCDEWKNNSKSFEQWALKNGYKQELTIDRINNDGDYEPSNCRFITMGENNKNKRNNIIIKIDEKQMCLKDYCKKFNFNYNNIIMRLKRGMSFKEAITTPFRNGGK